MVIKEVFAHETSLGKICGTGLGPFAEFLCKLTPGDNQNNAIKTMAAFAYMISNIIAVLVSVAGLWFMIQFIIGAFGWLSSSGDKARLEKAQQTILNAVIGLVIVMASFAFVTLIGKILGFDILITDPAGFVNKILNQ
jgi:hypothetical protein